MSRGKHRRPVAPQYSIAPPPVLTYPAPPPSRPAPSVTISVLGSKNATVARAVVTKLTKDWSGQEYVFEAAESSKREQGDVFDPVTGELLALSRAFQRLSRDLASEAHKRVKVSTEAQQKAREEAYRKAREPKQPVPRRTKEEWEAIQAKTTGNLIPPGFLNELQQAQADGERAAETMHARWTGKPEPAVRYNPADAEILSRWLDDDTPTLRNQPRPLDVPALRAARDNLNDLLKNLGDPG